MTKEHWFFAEHIPKNGIETVLSDAEASHAVRTRRLRIDDPLVIFDGKGQSAAARIIEISQRPLSVRLHIGERDWSPKKKPSLHLVSALPKGDRQNTMIDMATQLGVDALTPLMCERSVSVSRKGNRDRWDRIVIEACKQSHRPWLPTLAEESSLETFIRDIDEGATVFVGDSDGDKLGSFSNMSLKELEKVYLVIGPEGGFTVFERQLQKHAGFKMLSVGDGILRTETAAVSLVASIMGLVRPSSVMRDD